jgi:ribosomal protein S27AE
MNTATTWQAAESCPDCGTLLTLLDDGTSPVQLDCGSCGYTDSRAVTGLAGGDR